MSDGKDWYDWHRPYSDGNSPLARRPRLVQRHIAGWLDERPDRSLSVVSMCAGQGHDLLGVLSVRPDAGRVQARLIEYDPRNGAAARTKAVAENLGGVQVMHADAGDLASYAGAVPAAFHAPDDVLFSVGVHQLIGRPQPLSTAGKLFQFLR
jgi:hypothetical protein